MSNVEMDKKFEKLEKKLDEMMDKINKRMDYIELRLDNMDRRIDYMNKKMDYMESEIKTIKLTQNYIHETASIGLEKPLDSISLASFLADEKEENSYFKLFR